MTPPAAPTARTAHRAPGAGPRVSQLPTGPRHVHVEPIWGTVVTLELRGPQVLARPDRVARATETAVSWLRRVDAVFSTFRTDSEVSRLRRGDLGERAGCGDLREVLLRCRVAREVTQGAFDPWHVPGGFDPSGLVKGWAAERAADLLVASGFRHVKVDAGGDVVLRGGAGPDRPWVIGVQHPDDPTAVVATVCLADGAVATSGTYHRGRHVVDPWHGGPAGRCRAATAVGPDAGLADALATATLVAGRTAASWVHALPGWSLWAVGAEPADGRTPAWSIGPAFP